MRKPKFLSASGKGNSEAVIKSNQPKSGKESKPELKAPMKPGKNKSGKDILPYN